MGDEGSEVTAEPTSSTGAVPEGQVAGAAAPSAARSIGSPTVVLSSVLALLLIVVIAVALLLGRDASSPAPSTEEGAAGSTAAAGGVCGTPWPAAYQGAPNGMKTAPDAGFYVWWDGFGFHLRGVDPAGTAVFKGQIIADTELPKASAKVAPANADVTIDAVANVMSFSFKAGAAPSGLDIAICKPSQLSISVGNGTNPLPVGRIRTGVNRFAVSNPMVLTRR